jgi:hypothetical protein
MGLLGGRAGGQLRGGDQELEQLDHLLDGLDGLGLELAPLAAQLVGEGLLAIADRVVEAVGEGVGLVEEVLPLGVEVVDEGHEQGLVSGAVGVDGLDLAQGLEATVAAAVLALLDGPEVRREAGRRGREGRREAGVAGALGGDLGGQRLAGRICEHERQGQRGAEERHPSQYVSSSTEI